MSTTTAEPGTLPTPDLAEMERLRTQAHEWCFACGQGLFRLEFELSEAGAFRSQSFSWSPFFCGYEGVVHGGALALYFDQLMTCCLFAHGVEAVTARLSLRYLRPVSPEVPNYLEATVQEVVGPRFALTGRLVQRGQVKVRAEAQFWKRSGVNGVRKAPGNLSRSAVGASGESGRYLPEEPLPVRT